LEGGDEDPVRLVEVEDGDVAAAVGVQVVFAPRRWRRLLRLHIIQFCGKSLI